MANAARSRSPPNVRSSTSPTQPVTSSLKPVPSRATIPPLSASSSSAHVSSRQLQPLKSQIPTVPRRLLVPTSVYKCSNLEYSVRPIKVKSSSSKLSRSRANSEATDLLPPQSKDERRWFNDDFRFEVVEESLRLSGYQLYAVEKWIVDRSRATTLLSVYTGDPKDKITVTALAPSASLSSQEAIQEWDKAIHDLRRDGARPRETDNGVIMVTSLANFRSDFTVVNVPDGDFFAHREDLFVNINLLRMGCSGRSALTLQEPSDATKERFINMYQFNDCLRTQEQFKTTVLALVRLIQCSLSLFDMFPVDAKEQNGLLCDMTVDGIQKWVADVGEPYVKIEPTERVADPSTVAALLSLVLAMRNKLNVTGIQAVPKDPFLYPRRFIRTLAAFVNQRVQIASSSTSPSGSTICHHAYLNLALIKRIDMAFEKYKSSEAYKLHRVVLNKLDDLTTATTSAISSSKGSKSVGHGQSLSLSLSSKERDVEGLLEATADLAAFVGNVNLLRGKETAASLRYLWSGRLDQLERKLFESILSDAEEEREKERERSDSEDDGELVSALPWSGRVQKKLESWAGREFGRTRSRKSTSIDLSAKDRSSTGTRNHSTIALPSVIISKDPDEPPSGLSSGQVSPISPSTSLIALGSFSSAHASALNIDEAEYYRKLAQFDRMRPSLLDTKRLGIMSWSDPVSVVELEEELDAATARAASFTIPGAPGGSSLAPTLMEGAKTVGNEPDDGKSKIKHPPRTRLKRSRSFDDKDFMHLEDCLTLPRMQIDVDLCAQCLIMNRRKIHVEAVVAALRTFLQSTSASNAELRRYHEEHREMIHELDKKCQIAADIEEAVTTVDAIALNTDAVQYEAGFLNVQSLWRMAEVPRHRVFAIRERVFGRRGKRVSAESHGRFNRVIKRLDGQERLVDFMGRTESEVEEESELPESMPNDESSSETGESEDGRVKERDTLSASEEEGRLKALSNWLLTVFTNWGRVLGVGRAPAPTPDQSHPFEDKTKTSNGGANVNNHDGQAVARTRLLPTVLANGHNRLSTVGEEDEGGDEDVFHDLPSRQSIVSSPIAELSS